MRVRYRKMPALRDPLRNSLHSGALIVFSLGQLRSREHFERNWPTCLIFCTISSNIVLIHASGWSRLNPIFFLNVFELLLSVAVVAVSLFFFLIISTKLVIGQIAFLDHVLRFSRECFRRFFKANLCRATVTRLDEICLASIFPTNWKLAICNHV